MKILLPLILCLLSIITIGTIPCHADYSPHFGGPVHHIVVQPDGEIIVGGNFIYVNEIPRRGIARLNKDLTLDSQFNPNCGGAVRKAVVQPDGSIIIGFWSASNCGVSQSWIARLRPDGTLDSTFAPNLDNAVYALAVQTDGKILVGGTFERVDGYFQPYLTRLNPDGTRDQSFNTSTQGEIWAIVVQGNDQILIGGNFTQVNGQERTRIARLNVDGSTDGNFSPTIDSGNVLSLALHLDGRIVLGGTFSGVNSTQRRMLARLLPDGGLDTSFSPDLGGSGGINSVLLQADGKLLVASNDVFFSEPHRLLFRLHEDGSLDLAFNPDPDGKVSGLAIQSDSKILIGGGFARVGSYSRFSFARLMSSGVVDTTTAPVANADSYNVVQENTLTITAPGVLGNDTDADSDELTATLVSSTTNGTLNFNSDGSFSYRSNVGFNGIDSFTYKANDGSLDSNVVTVSITVNPAPTPPNAPTGLSATAASKTQINLAWADNSGNESGFKIERCGKGRNCGNAVEIAQVAANTRNYSVTGLTKGTSFSFRVRAFNGSGYSPYSNIATATTPRK